jgi:EmrB/QacA subfamily drug resistance transporter
MMGPMLKSPCDEGVVRSAQGDGPPCRHSKGILAATILGSGLAFIDGTVVNVALPALQRTMHATVTDVAWVIEAYALTLSALLLAGGALGDRFGRRRVYAVGVILFAVASALCGLAPSVRLLILARGIQGVGAALLVPGSLAILAASFPERERGRAIGTWSGFSAMTTALGPVLGGWVIDHLSWRWAFFVNLPIAVATLFLLLRYVPESRDPKSARLDFSGATLATLGLGGVVYALIESSQHGWGHVHILGALIVGVAALVAFVTVEARKREPMLPLSLFRSRTFAGANLLTLGLYAALAILFFVLPLYLIQVHGYSATAAGAALLPLIVIMFALSRWSGGLIERFGARLPLIIGPSVAAIGFALVARTGVGSSYATTILPAIVVLGLGLALSVAPLTTTVMNSVAVSHAGIASGVNNAASRTAGLIAIAAMSGPLLHVFGAEMDRRLAAGDVRPAVHAEVRAQYGQLANLKPPPSATPEESAAIRAAVPESFVRGFRMLAWTAAGLALVSAVAAARTIHDER